MPSSLGAPIGNSAEALRRVVLSGDLEMMKALVEHGVDPARSDVLPTAAAAPNEDLALYLLAHGAPVDSDDGNGVALHRAAAAGNVRVLAALLDAGANVNLAGRMGQTPLHLAAKYARPEAVVVLLAHKAAVDAVDDSGGTALRRAADGPIDGRPSDGPAPDWSETARYVRVIELLIAAGADPQRPDGSNATAASIIARNRNADFKARATRALTR